MTIAVICDVLGKENNGTTIAAMNLIRSLREKADTLTANLDQAYLDKLSGILEEADFQRITAKWKAERSGLERACQVLCRKKETSVNAEEEAAMLVRQFIEQACTRRELLTNLIERVELTQDRRLIIRFRFRQPERTGSEADFSAASRLQ